jgi:putative aminopeptidase FrvX
MTPRMSTALALLVVAASARAQTAPVFAPTERLLWLSRIPGVSGHEDDVRKAVASMLKASLRPEIDTLGNIVVRIGTGAPRTLVVAPLDESGYVVSGITEDGYLRLHRPTPGPTHPLFHEYQVGQPVLIRTATGAYVNGVTATPSTHLRANRPPGTDTAPRTIDDLFVDVGAATREEVAARGIRMLDPVTLRERVTKLAGEEVAGIAVSARSGSTALVEIANRSADAKVQGSVTLAWTGQAFFAQRGLLRLIETEKPDRLIVFTGSLAPAKDALGSSGEPGLGPLIRDDDALFAASAAATGTRFQRRTTAELPFAAPRGVETHVIALPSRHAQTPVETVDARDLEAAARIVANAAGLGALGPGSAVPSSPAPPAVTFAEPDLRLLAGLVRAYGVATHEEPVRAEVLRRLPAWAKPEIDKKGNVIVRFGQGEKRLLFVAHTDEVGFEITSINEDGTAAVKGMGGMYFSLYEAHPVLVHTAGGPKEAVLAPRRGYATSTALEPEIGALVLETGAESRAQAESLGFAVGQSITPRKDLVKLGDQRASARGLDDRNGSTALLQAISRLDPKLVKNQLTFVWSVEEETGLAGAAFIAETEKFDTAFAIDTFVSSDTPVDSRRIAYAPLGKGAVLRGLDGRTLVPAAVMDRIVALAKESTIPLQIGVTGGGTDASPFSPKGAVDVGLSWPGRYSHSPVEVMDRRDLESLTRLLVVLAQKY